MSRSGDEQITIDDFDLGVEHIPGAMPPGQQDIDQARRELYEQIQAGYSGLQYCIPDQKIHVFTSKENDNCRCRRTKGNT